MDEPTRVKHYEILSRIGEGGMGVVYRARDTRLGRLVALKTLHRELAADEERVRRFEREARIVSSMSHPGIATLYDFDREGDLAYFAMELVEGPTLRDLLRDGPLEVEQALDCALQVAEALFAAHREGVTHRDLKPENIMVTGNGFYKVLDFGVARLDEPSAPEGGSGTQTPTISWATRAGGIVGTVSYMSPEQALGEPVDPRSDIFSFGSLLYETLTGRRPFRGNNEIATAQAIVNASHEPVRSLRSEVSPGLGLVLDKCMAKRPADRYGSAEELIADLRTLASTSHSGTRPLHGLVAYRSSPHRRRRVRWTAGLACAGIVAAIAIVGAVWQPWTEVDSAGTPVATEIRGPVPAPALPADPAMNAVKVRPRVIVAFFENNSGDAQADWLTRGLPEMLTTDLSRSGSIEVIATQKIYDLLNAAGHDSARALDRTATAELARWAGANIVISGSVFRSGELYRIDAQAYDTTSGTVLAAHKVEGAGLFGMVETLTQGLLGGLSVRGAKDGSLLQVTTSSEEAFRAYTRGRASHDRLSFELAERGFREALAADPQFALARLRLALTRLAAGKREAALPLIREVASKSERLPEAERLLAESLDAFFTREDLEAGARGLEELVRKYPDDKDAYVVWASALSEATGNTVLSAGKLRAALERDPGNLPAIGALATQLADLGEGEAARALLEGARQRNPEASEGIDALIESLAEPRG